MHRLIENILTILCHNDINFSYPIPANHFNAITIKLQQRSVRIMVIIITHSAYAMASAN